MICLWQGDVSLPETDYVMALGQRDTLSYPGVATGASAMEQTTTTSAGSIDSTIVLFQKCENCEM